MENIFFKLIKYNKRRFIVLGIGMVVIIAALVTMMILDPMPWWGVTLASVIIGGSISSTLWHWRKYRKWEEENEDSAE